jgi:hypothetical protein
VRVYEFKFEFKAKNVGQAYHTCGSFIVSLEPLRLFSSEVDG